jgi:hypothetical protein
MQKLLIKSEKESIICFFYKDETELLRSQQLLMELGKLINDSCDEVDECYRD